MKIRFEKEKETKNTIRFKEIMENEYGTPKIGSLYVKKDVLDELGWKSGALLTVELEVKN